VAIAGERRRRRTPDEARQEILGATASLLAERASQEVTVSAIMGRTTLSRKAFYVYFRNRADVLAALLTPLREETDLAIRAWREADDIVEAGRAALRSAAWLYHRHGPTLRALAAASAQDPEAAHVWQSFIEPLVIVAAEKIAQAAEAGGGAGLDPEPTARALVCLNVHYLLERLADAPVTEIEPAVETLIAIWERTIFLRHPAP
jgi:TetR/AcrR family transcriptional regulator, ethionamide resistance regulator